MRDRVVGIETEYAVVYFPARGETGRPTNLELYPVFERHLAERLPSVPRAASLLRSKPGRFLANGMSFHYEATPDAFEHGLLEIASPECRDPFTLLHHELAKDALAEELRDVVNRELSLQGWRGELRLLKNNVDGHGHTFGSHESYWVDDPLTASERLALVPLWLATWALTLPVFLWLAVAMLGFLALPLVLLAAPLLGALLSALAGPLRGRLPRVAAGLAQVGQTLVRGTAGLVARWQTDPGEWVRRLAWIETPFRWCIPIHSRLYGRFFFRKALRGATAFLATRSLFAGGGAVAWSSPGLLRLSQRAPFLQTTSAMFTHGDRRPMIELRDPFFRPWSLLGRRRRLHLMLGDANLCEWALVLRVGATALVLEAIEADPGAAWPQLADPLDAQWRVSADPGAELQLADGGRLSALALQRRVLAEVQRILGEPAEDWKRRVLALWDETLRELERDADRLADRIDWVAKRSLVAKELASASPGDAERLAAAGASLVAGAPPREDEERARLRRLAFRVLRADLRYHELGPRGGHRKLLERGRIRRLADPAEVARARTRPPRDTRAAAREAAIREAAAQGGAATWHRVRVGLFDWRFFRDPLDPTPS